MCWVGSRTPRGRSTFGWSYLGKSRLVGSRSIFSTLFARGQQAADVFNVHVVNIIRNPTAARGRTRSINSTLFGRWQHRCGLLLSVLQQLDVGAKSDVYDCNCWLCQLITDMAMVAPTVELAEYYTHIGATVYI